MIWSNNETHRTGWQSPLRWFMPVVLLAAPAVQAETLAQCAAIVADTERLACYDTLARNAQPVLDASPVPEKSAEALEDEFGRTARMESNPLPEDSGLSAMTATVVALDRRGRGETVYSLDNGQLWAETQQRSGLRPRVGDQVRIARGRFGGFRLFGEGQRGYRVERLR